VLPARATAKAGCACCFPPSCNPGSFFVIPAHAYVCSPPSHRTDFYQTLTSVIASFFLKKINKDEAKVEFQEREVVLDLPTTDTPVKRYKTRVPLYAAIDPAKSTFKVLGTKLEVTLAKADGTSWPVLRSDDRPTGEILQVGRAGKV
jgi:hypothetical protein